MRIVVCIIVRILPVQTSACSHFTIGLVKETTRNEYRHISFCEYDEGGRRGHSKKLFKKGPDWMLKIFIQQ